MRIRLVPASLLVLVLLASACTSAQTTLTSTPAPSAAPTASPTNTATSLPTPSPEPGWDYVALGDSNPGGFGVSHSYVGIYADYMTADLGMKVRRHKWAFNGATSNLLLSKLQTNIELQKDIREAEIVTIDIGANDWTPAIRAYAYQECGDADNQDCLRELLQSYRQNFDAVLNEILELRGAENKILLRTVDLYMSNCDFANIYGVSGIFRGLKPYLDEFNTYISQATQAHNGAVVPLYLAFNGPDGDQNPVELLQADQCHLNPAGHQRVADMLRQLGYENDH